MVARQWVVGGWKTAASTIDSLIYPRFCPVCDGWTGGTPFCGDCRAALLGSRGGLRCPRCALAVGPFSDLEVGCSQCRNRALGFDRAITLGSYRGPVRQLCLSLKHQSNGWIARWLAELVVEANASAFRAEVRPGTLVVPVPLHWWRRVRRGYNQADDLATGIARALSLRVARPLRRVVASPPLALLSRTERAKVMRGAFRAVRPRRLAGKTILLVDDILTTGATTGAAARALKKAGASRVVTVVVARAEGKP